MASMIELIRRKRDGEALSAEEVAWVIAEYTAEAVPDYQMAAMLMAIFHRGLDPAELAAWTEAMLHSGDVLDLSAIAAPKVDKHSTGGIGDKASIPLAPMVAACGIAVPMMSGRGLGHTGGTLDKLESIPGFRTALDPAEFADIVDRVGLVLAGQSETLVPADRRMYALRDATGTVPSIPLIASSIMSKKLAEDLDGLVLDVKVGSGAFMKDETTARRLADTMIGIGQAHDTPVTAVLSDMDQPLGREVGNANEIIESIAVLRGEGPPDLVELVYALGAEMLALGGVTQDRAEAHTRLETAVTSGAALDVFASVIEAQGGDPSVVESDSALPTAPHRTAVTAAESGFVIRCDALDIGLAAVSLGAGRERKEDSIDPGVGITVLKKLGDGVEKSERLAVVAYRDDGRLEAARRRLDTAWQVGPEPVILPPLVLDTVA